MFWVGLSLGLLLGIMITVFCVESHDDDDFL